MDYHSQLFNKLSDREVNGLEAKVPSLFNYIPTNPTGHYRLFLSVRDSAPLGFNLDPTGPR